MELPKKSLPNKPIRFSKTKETSLVNPHLDHRKIDAVVICPCSGTTIGKIAAGISDNLVTRSAIVAMKERRKLIIVPREAPYATVHLENMTKLSSWNTVIIPASPGFYNHPETIDDLIDFIIARILDHIGIDNEIGKRWTGDEI